MNKLELLKEALRQYEKVAIAYSGGCDSNFLMNVAVDTLGKENVLSVLCLGEMMSKEDIEDAKSLLKGLNHKVIPVSPLEVKEFKYNDKKRCYFCKKMIMSTIIEEARKEGFEYVLDGKNLDDEGVYRPGIQASKELGIISLMADVGLTKKEIRNFSKELGIVTHDKPANACLASRFDYNVELTLEKLERVAKAEALFHTLGIHHVRVRVQDELARIEVEKEEFSKVIEDPSLVEKMKALGFRFVTLDLNGITSGSYDK